MAYIKPTNQQEQPARAWGNNNNSYQQQQTPIQPPQTPEKLPVKIYTGKFLNYFVEKEGIINNGKNAGKQWIQIRLTMTNQYGDKEFKRQFYPFPYKDSMKVEDLQRNVEYTIKYIQEPFTDNSGVLKKSNKVMGVYPVQQPVNKIPYTPNPGAFKPQSSFQQQPLASAPMYAPPQQQTPVKQFVNEPQIPPKTILIAPEHQQLWDNNNFSSKEEWMRIAEDSRLFDSPEEAERVWKMLSGE